MSSRPMVSLAAAALVLAAPLAALTEQQRRDHLAWMQQHLPNAQLIVYPDSSHAPFYQYQDLFLAHAALFLDDTK